MQSAHKIYKQASATLDALTAMSPRTGGSVERDLQIEVAATEQRTSFENYIEARLQLSEFLLSKQMPVDPAVLHPEVRHGENDIKTPRLAVLAVVAAFLLPTAFGLGFLAHERQRNRELNTARDESAAALNQTRGIAEELARRVETLQAAQLAASRRAVAPAPRPRTNHARPVQNVALKTSSAAAKVARSHEEVVQLQRRGDRNYHEFTFTPSKHAERIGGIALSVANVDPQRKSFDVSITVDNRTLNKKRVSLYEPVWFDLSGRPKAVELVVNQINWDRLQGYLSEPKSPRTALERLFPVSDLLATR